MRKKSTSTDGESRNRFAAIHVRELDEPERRSVVELAVGVLAELHQPGRDLTSPGDTRTFLRLELSSAKAEVFGVIFLDNRHRVITLEHLFHGTIDGASVHPRIVVQRALEVNAAAAILFHNHPSGEPEPSHADRALTRRLREAMSLVDIRLLDHIVVGGQATVSFAERGLL